MLTEESYWSEQEGALSPDCVFVPSSVEDVSMSISTLAKSNCKFAVKGGGHAPAAGFAKQVFTIQGLLMLQLRDEQI